MMFDLIIGVIIGIFCTIAIGLLLNLSAKETPPDAEIHLVGKKLKMHELNVAILKERAIDEPEETLRRIKKDFANQMIKILEDDIEVEADPVTDHLKFSIRFWTKEAENERKQTTSI